jgi:hypothetical protein
VQATDTIKPTKIMDDFRLTKNFERFDEQRYNKRYNKELDLVVTMTDGTRVRLDRWSEGACYSMLPTDSYLELIKIYYVNGNIKCKGYIITNGGACVGKWYEFNESGELVREIDYDKIFTFSFDDIQKFCKKKGIELKKGYVQYGFKTYISNCVEGGCWWKIEYLKKSDLVEIIRLDGKTGKILSTTTYEHSVD